ncbi:non-ribosomal peptide synthetase [Actinoalloteichus hymeniacidonis]|uniref:Amino acid adenylation enzyme/thioester reductase family protein n=1 Tax=Actinoalloteichus hymeniacidonis TaxID=340345 RepID=A0AAC9MWZ8_9PSEU|nr:non-ribosomal peptide synthetase [Actinoalloteichus hymeniacidonis]AOS61830.1 amino acid adenylation enzyme/thioester reductase family protein [Actinoalloteichus hymeniacidonis]MBB5910150.1 amino acid adenylation domain-containing protein [Actinoalloteichus hymeniacidonis]
MTDDTAGGSHSARCEPALPPLIAEPAAAAESALSLQQEQIWFLHRLAPESVAHHALATIRITGAFDLDRLDRACTELGRRHEILRTGYPEVGGEPRQVVHPPQPVRATRFDIGDVRDGRSEALADIVAQELRRPFRITELPLLRWTVVRLADTEHELIVVRSDLLDDGRSFALLLREFTALYNADAQGIEIEQRTAMPPGQYRDFARWQRAALATSALGAQLAYWRERLADLPPLLDLPMDHPRPAAQSFRGETLRVELPTEIAAGIRAFCAAQRATPFEVMLAAFYTLLYRYTGQRDLCVGSWFPGRETPGTEELLGRFVNTVLLRCEVDATLGFRDLVAKVRAGVQDAKANELLPFTELIRVLNPAREAGRNPLTDVFFSMDDSPLPQLDLAGATGISTEHGNGSTKMDLNVRVLPSGPDPAAGAESADDRITMLWEYAADLFDPATVRRMADSWQRLLTDAITRPTAPLFELAVLSPQDRVLVLDEWNPERDQPTDDGPLVHHAVRAQARRTPDAPAIREGVREVGYAELVQRADSLAVILRDRGVRPRTVVGVCLPRGADLVIAELAVLFAGAAYLPLDPENPPARMADQYAAADAVLIITDSVVADRLPGDLRRLSMDRLPIAAQAVEDAPPDATTPDDLAYLIATSGSTGQPKIVMIEHGSLTNAVAWRCRRCELGTTDRIAQVASPGFDTSVMDIWPTLVSGATLYVPDQDTRLDPERLRTWLVDERITVTELPTALAERVLTLPWPAGPAMRTLITGGDRLRVRPAADLSFRVLNEYGPSEATATATAGEIEPVGVGQGPPDIGRPITGVAGYLLDAWRRPVPPGVTGELWIGGVGVARGYHGAAAITSERFVPDPFAAVPGRRMYRTGDLARHLPDGRIAFLGRRDRQIKLRGYRIEPAEIVEALRAHPEIVDAVVLATADGAGEKRLVAYLEAVDRPMLRQQVREHLADRLPRYMVPADFVLLDSLPLNRNGKVDERALPAPGPAERALDFRAPDTGTQRWLAEVWCTVLGLDRVGLDENFFDIGGHSLLLASVQRELAARGHELSIVTFFEYPTIHDLARFLDDRAGDAGRDAAESERAVRRGVGRARLNRRRAAVRSAGGVDAVGDR